MENIKNKYFPENEFLLNQVLDTYKREIVLKAEWIINNISKSISFYNQRKPSKEIMENVMNAVNYAMSIYRLINVAGARNKSLASERVRLLTARWPELPKAPEGLKLIRDDLEHFEERLDSWVVDAKRVGNYSLGDLGVGFSEDMKLMEGMSDKGYLRSISNQWNFKFWEHSVSLIAIFDWAQDLITYLTQDKYWYEPL
ncbi:hypothetical protein P4668_25285 [Priestia megaterium]|uniref:hypothetical protein n=1 Tax=Priestia megaterium TaxID=1404 RepID=UPI002E21A80E|nr:hypothetical protein [Priestia megaterium]